MIPQIYIMAALTLALSLGLWGGLIYLFTGRQKRYFWLLVLGLPLSAIANLVFKAELAEWVGRAAQIEPYLGLAAPAWFVAYKMMLTPLVEETLKAAPLLLRPVRRMVTSRMSTLWVGFVLGVSFGLGEAAFLAYGIAQAGVYNHLPWYAFTGYLNERLLACFAHGVLTAILVRGLQRGGWFTLYGFGASMGLHLFLNTPSILYALKWISFELYNFALVVPFIVLAVIFERVRRAAREPKEDQHSDEVVFWQREGNGAGE